MSAMIVKAFSFLTGSMRVELLEYSKKVIHAL